jgi:lysozyme
MARVSLRAAVTTLTISAAAVAGWVRHEGDGPTTVADDGTILHHPYIPTKGDVPTIGHGSTRYEDGRPVRLTDPPITRQRAESLARALHDQHEREFKASLPGAVLSQAEFDLYLDFTGQYGIGNWRQSSMRRHILAGRHRAACDALLDYRFITSPVNLGPGWEPRDNGPGFKFDCSQHINGKRNTLCYGVWARQQERHARCIAEQDRIDWLAGTQLEHFEVAQ